jgi:hypothetical protein
MRLFRPSVLIGTCAASWSLVQDGGVVVPHCAANAPVPAIVVMIPCGLTRRIRWAWWMYKLSSGPSAMPPSPFILALVAGPPSPLKPETPVPSPATQRITPSGPMTRMDSLPASVT